MKKKQIIVAVIASFIPAVAFAGPSLGIGYSDVGLSGHSGRPGVQIGASNLYSNDVYAAGSAIIASNFYQVQAKLGKRIAASGVIVEPYLSAGFINMNYNQTGTGFTTQTFNGFGGASFTNQVPYSYTQPVSIQDFYGLAGADMYVPIGKRVSIELGGGYGHTLDTFSGASGAVYKGKAALNFGIAKHVFGDLQATYLHVPGQSVTEYGAGVSYHFS